MTHELAEDLFIGWLQDPSTGLQQLRGGEEKLFSWKVFAGAPLRGAQEARGAVDGPVVRGAGKQPNRLTLHPARPGLMLCCREERRLRLLPLPVPGARRVAVLGRSQPPSSCCILHM